MSTNSGFQSHTHATRRLLALLLLALGVFLAGCVEESDGSSNDSLIGDGSSGESSSGEGGSESGDQNSGGGSGSASDDQSDVTRDDDDSEETDDTSGQVTLSWEPPATREDGEDFLPSEVDYYVVRYRHEDEDFQTLDSPAEITSTSVDINTLTPGERYPRKP